MEELKITSLEELKNMSTEIIELSPFSGTNPFYVRVKRLSILGLCNSGQVPNQLLGVARKLFYQENIQQIDLKEYGNIIDIICKNTLVEPSIEQLKEIGLELTDSQRFELWAYSQQGVEGLKSFRAITKSTFSDNDGQKIQDKTKQNFKHN
ncbi:hypothetical protein [Clostridium drakei]|uniref:Uncharacterized protein n=1 Tax=Clostridium drakei TaxID=332101 RepID=A0A2U8DPH8_9CLOT|nr:hypothetical protein [Clostridium drakei]AWI04134.1 hypothetical protein B9W14_06370 [Clostridium drakei]